jgi:spore germination protein KC
MKRGNKNVLLAIVMVLFSSILLAGCWDYRELEKRALVVGLGIDELPPSHFAGKEVRMYQVIVQVVETAGSSSQAAMQKQQQSAGYTNFIIQTPSITEGIQQIITQSERFPLLSHLQLIVLGEKLSKKGVHDLFDFFTRFPQMRRHTEIIATTRPLIEYFTVPSTAEPTPSLHIASIAGSVQQTLLMPESNLGIVSKNIRNNTPFVLLTASLNKKRQIVINQGTVFQNAKKVGILSKSDIQNLSMLYGEIERGLLHFSCSQGKRAALQVLAGNSKIRPTIKNGKPHIMFQVELETELTEYQCSDIVSFDSPEQIRRIEHLYSNMLEEQLQRTVETLKKKYKDDIFRLTPRLKNYPEMYKQIREHPEQFFEQLTADINVNLKIRNIGNVLKTSHFKLER